MVFMDVAYVKTQQALNARRPRARLVAFNVACLDLIFTNCQPLPRTSLEYPSACRCVLRETSRRYALCASLPVIIWCFRLLLLPPPPFRIDESKLVWKPWKPSLTNKGHRKKKDLT